MVKNKTAFKHIRPHTKWILGLLIPIIGAFCVAYYQYRLSPKPEEKNSGGVSIGDSATLSAGKDIILSGRDTNIQQLIQGIDERELAEYLNKLKTKKKRDTIFL